MKLFKPLVFATLCFVGTAHAATSQAFKDAAALATKQYNNVKDQCLPYAKTLDSFLKANAAKYGIKSYAFYNIRSTNAKSIYMIHDDVGSGTPITSNGRHVIAVIDGEVFDNFHSKGSIQADWESKLHNPDGTYPKAFTTLIINNIQTEK